MGRVKYNPRGMRNPSEQVVCRYCGMLRFPWHVPRCNKNPEKRMTLNRTVFPTLHKGYHKHTCQACGLPWWHGVEGGKRSCPLILSARCRDCVLNNVPVAPRQFNQAQEEELRSLEAGAGA